MRLQRKSLASPDEVRAFPNGKVEIFELDEIVVGRTVFQPGWRWSSDVKPIAGTPLCQYHHMGVVISGILRVEMEDGSSMEIGPNLVFEIPPNHDAWVVGDEPWVTVDFAGMRSFARTAETRGERILASILFTDIVDSTALAVRLGDSRWRELLAQHNQRGRFELDRFRGREIATTGDGFLALFDGSERAVRCGAAMRESIASLGLSIRAGVHTGEVELVPGNVRGIAVHTASRIMSMAEAGQVLISGTTHELLAGSGLEFADRGAHALKGLTGTRQLYELVSSSAVLTAGNSGQAAAPVG
jgi:class 3 adenylate cyclase